MREIKFRAWDGERMVSVYRISNGFACHPESGEEKPEWNLMQFTGLLDQNDIEIYEGDIITMTIQPTDWNKEHFAIFKEVRKPALVRWDEYLPGFSLWFEPAQRMHPCYDHLRLADSDAEVVGNIYENPELLEAK